MYKLLLLLTGLVSFNKGFNQVFENDAAKREENFIARVKQIDEFFERFDDKPTSFLRAAYKRLHIPYKISRPDLMKSLFNHGSKSWDMTDINDFVNNGLAVKMNLKDDNWFAEAVGKFNNHGQMVNIPVILKTITNNKGGVKWIITGVQPGGFVKETSLLPVTPPQNARSCISPTNHNNDFCELIVAFRDKKNLSAYFDNGFFRRPHANAFFQAVLSEKLQLVSLKCVKYYFLQVNNYVFTVEWFERPTKNSGWLINTLQPASPFDKETFKKTLLGN
jgi:hypothetical protein